MTIIHFLKLWHIKSKENGLRTCKHYIAMNEWTLLIYIQVRNEALWRTEHDSCCDTYFIKCFLTECSLQCIPNAVWAASVREMKGASFLTKLTLSCLAHKLLVQLTIPEHICKHFPVWYLWKYLLKLYEWKWSKTTELLWESLRTKRGGMKVEGLMRETRLHPRLAQKFLQDINTVIQL